MTGHSAPVAITGEDSTEQEWMEARANHRVTASEIHTIAAGGRSTWQRILKDKLNGRTFKGNETTKRGHTREPFLLAYLAEWVNDTIEPNSRLYVHPLMASIGATPDAMGSQRDRVGRVQPFGVEVKSHGYEWGDREDIPAEHYDQMQLGMYVLGFPLWLYGWEVMGPDGEPTLDQPKHRWVERDEARIEFLVRQACAFLDWWDEGAPAADDVPAELDDALAAWADARARKNTAAADEKAAEQIVRAHIAAHPTAAKDGLKLAGRAASFVYAVKTEDVLDADAWAEAEPDLHREWVSLRERADATATAAAALYHKQSRSTRLNITPTKEAA